MKDSLAETIRRGTWSGIVGSLIYAVSFSFYLTIHYSLIENTFIGFWAIWLLLLLACTISSLIVGVPVGILLAYFIFIDSGKFAQPMKVGQLAGGFLGFSYVLFFEALPVFYGVEDDSVSQILALWLASTGLAILAGRVGGKIFEGNNN